MTVNISSIDKKGLLYSFLKNSDLITVIYNIKLLIYIKPTTNIWNHTFNALWNQNDISNQISGIYAYWDYQTKLTEVTRGVNVALVFEYWWTYACIRIWIISTIGSMIVLLLSYIKPHQFIHRYFKKSSSVDAEIFAI